MPKKPVSLEISISDSLAEAFGFTEKDVKPIPMKAVGESVYLSNEARRTIGNIHIECKELENVNLWDSLRRIKVNAGSFNPVLILKRKRTLKYAVVEYDYLQRLMVTASAKRINHEG